MMDKRLLETKAFSVFICYANEDEDLYQEFKKHLASLQLSGAIAELHDPSMILAGQEREATVMDFLDHADIIFLLVSANFISSQSCIKQTKRAMEKHTKKTVSVIPIRIRQALWNELPFADLQPLPENDKAVNDFTDRDGAWADIARRIKEVLKNQSSLLPESEQGSLNDYLQEGKALFANERYEDALKKYQQVIDMKPNLAVAHSFQGQALYELGQYEDALHSCNQAVQLGSQLADTFDYEGLACYRLGLYHEAIDAFDQAIKLAPDCAQAYDHKAHVLCRLKQPREALEYCKQALVYDAKLASAYDNQGWALYQLQQYSEALDACKKALQLNPDLATAYYNKGRVLYMLKHDLQALEAYEQAITCYDRSRKKGNGMLHLSHSIASIYRNKGKAYIELRNYKEARKSFEQAIKDYEQAMKAYQQAIEKHKERFNSPQHARIIAFYRQTIRAIQQECAEAYDSNGEALYQDNDPKKALQAFKAAIQLYSEVIQHNVEDHDKEELEKRLARVYVKRAHAQFRRKQYKQVLKECDEALHHDNRLGSAYSIRADTLEKLHSYREADEARRKANNSGD